MGFGLGDLLTLQGTAGNSALSLNYTHYRSPLRLKMAYFMSTTTLGVKMT
jgi:hypothetical protein